MAEYRRALLGALRGDVLEIGPGTGANLPYYASDIRWMGIEPNTFMHRYLRNRAESLGLNVDLRTGTAERLGTDDELMDAVADTLVLCHRLRLHVARDPSCAQARREICVPRTRRSPARDSDTANLELGASRLGIHR